MPGREVCPVLGPGVDACPGGGPGDFFYLLFFSAQGLAQDSCAAQEAAQRGPCEIFSLFLISFFFPRFPFFARRSRAGRAQRGNSF